MFTPICAKNTGTKVSAHFESEFRFTLTIQVYFLPSHLRVHVSYRLNKNSDLSSILNSAINPAHPLHLMIASISSHEQ